MSTTGISGIDSSSALLQLWQTLLKGSESSAFTTSTADSSDSSISELLSSLGDNSDALSGLLESNSGLSQMGRQHKMESSEDVFAKLDSNSDNAISEEEMIAAFGSTDGAAKFAEADTDGDGSVTATELKTAMESGGQTQMSKELFAKLDTNSDDAVSEEEMIAAFGSTDGASKFAAADTDSDGSVTLDELKTAMGNSTEAMGPPPPPPPGGAGGIGAENSSGSTSVFSAIDTNGDGTISEDELNAYLENNSLTANTASNSYSRIQNLLTALLSTTIDTTG
jgi:Ca2+-binding EF-hand superfamily protein